MDESEFTGTFGSFKKLKWFHSSVVVNTWIGISFTFLLTDNKRLLDFCMDGYWINWISSHSSGNHHHGHDFLFYTCPFLPSFLGGIIIGKMVKKNNTQRCRLIHSLRVKRCMHYGFEEEESRLIAQTWWHFEFDEFNDKFFNILKNSHY